MKLAVLIVNFRTPDLTAACIGSVVPQLRAIGDSRAFVVENGSGDDSLARLREAIDANGWGDDVTLIESNENRGFAGGNNLAHARCRDAEFVLLLNSDTLVHDGCLPYCYDLMRREPRIGAMSCLLKNPDGSPQTTARKFPTLLRELVSTTNLAHRLPALFGWADTEDLAWDRNTVKRDVEWIGGAFMFCRGDMVRSIGLLDEEFFFYGEDIEFNHRIHRAGYRVHYDPAMSILHYGGASSDPKRLAAARRRAATWTARYMTMRKCYGKWSAAVLRCADATTWGTRRLLLRLMGRKGDAAWAEADEVWTLLTRGRFDNAS